MAILLGVDGKLSYGTAGAKATTEVTTVTDVTFNLSAKEADVTNRSGNGWALTITSLFEGSVEFDLFVDPEDTVYSTLLAAFLARTVKSFFFDIGDGSGVDFDGCITQFNFSQAMSEGQKVSVVVKPTASTRAPAWVAAPSA